MRAEHVGGQRLGDVAERLPDVRGAGAVIDHGRPKLGDRALIPRLRSSRSTSWRPHPVTAAPDV